MTFPCWKLLFLSSIFKQLLLKNCAVDFVEICNVCARKVIIKAAKRIFNSDKICRSYCDFCFGVTFLEHTVYRRYISYPIFLVENIGYFQYFSIFITFKNLLNLNVTHCDYVLIFSLCVLLAYDLCPQHFLSVGQLQTHRNSEFGMANVLDAQYWTTTT